MPDSDEQNKERSKITLRIGEVQVELEGTNDSIKKLMDKELVDFTKRFEETTKQLPSSTEHAPEVAPKAPEVAPKAPEVAPKEKPAPPLPSKTSTKSEPSSWKSRLFKRGKKTEKTDKRKIRWKPLAVALVLVCIVLSAGLVAAVAVYMPMVSSLESQVAERDDTISSLTSQVTAFQSTLAQTALQLDDYQDQVDSLNASLYSMNAQLSDYYSKLYLQQSGILNTGEFTQYASNYTVIWNDVVEFAGYVTVGAQSTSNTTYAQMIYSSFGLNYDQNVTLGTSGNAVFPVLPGAIELRIGNTELADNVTTTVTATYYY